LGTAHQLCFGQIYSHISNAAQCSRFLASNVKCLPGKA
jgi:hypothetical protein